MSSRDTTTSSPDSRTSGGGRPRAPREMTLSEERLRVGTVTEETGRLRAVKRVDTELVERQVPRGVEHADVQREEGLQGDSGEIETLEDGSLSIPVFEEQIVVEKRLVVRERIIIRKHTVYEDQVISAEVRRERLELETEGDVQLSGDAFDEDAPPA